MEKLKENRFDKNLVNFYESLDMNAINYQKRDFTEVMTCDYCETEITKSNAELIAFFETVFRGIYTDSELNFNHTDIYFVCPECLKDINARKNLLSMSFNHFHDFGSDYHFVWGMDGNYKEKKRKEMYQMAEATIGTDIEDLKKYKTKEELKLARENRELNFHLKNNYKKYKSLKDGLYLALFGIGISLLYIILV